MRTLVTLGAIAAVFVVASAVRAANDIVQKDKQFSEQAISVKSGDKVRFVNDDNVAHNITVVEPNGQSRPGIVQKPGETSDVAFDKVGAHEVRCLIHPKMKMSVEVK